MDNTKEPPTLLSFCTGYGGIERGIERAIGAVRVLAHVEIEAYAIENLVDKMEEGKMVSAPVWTNVKTFPCEIFRGKVDILTAGYPCQPFSAAGQRKGKDDPRHLWPYIKRAISIIQPRICFFENVEGHISLGLREVLADLVGIGYRVESECGEPTWGAFSASEVGAPHQRKRVFIMAYRDNGLRELTEKQICTRWNPFNIGGEELADPNSDGSGENIQSTELRPIGTDQSPCNSGRGEASEIREEWPARPGEEQYEWEEPRVI